MVDAEVKIAPAQLRKAFLAAARDGDDAAQSITLLAWARAERPALQNLGELSAALASEVQAAAIAALQRKHYAGVDEHGLGARLAKAFEDGFMWRQDAPAVNTSPLPPLYPFNLDR